MARQQQQQRAGASSASETSDAGAVATLENMMRKGANLARYIHQVFFKSETGAAPKLYRDLAVFDYSKKKIVKIKIKGQTSLERLETREEFENRMHDVYRVKYARAFLRRELRGKIDGRYFLPFQTTAPALIGLARDGARDLLLALAPTITKGVNATSAEDVLSWGLALDHGAPDVCAALLALLKTASSADASEEDREGAYGALRGAVLAHDRARQQRQQGASAAPASETASSSEGAH